jgi:hypothetical protein
VNFQVTSFYVVQPRSSAIDDRDDKSVAREDALDHGLHAGPPQHPGCGNRTTSLARNFGRSNATSS